MCARGGGDAPHSTLCGAASVASNSPRVGNVSGRNGRCRKGVDPVLDGYPKLIAIDEEPDDEIVHGRRLGKADRATDEPFNPGP